MAIRKTGVGQITETEQDEALRRQAAKQDWTDEDNLELAAENAEADQDDDE